MPATIQLTGDEVRLLQSLDRVIQKEKQLAQTQQDGARTSRQAGSEMQGMLTGLAAKWLSVGGAVGLLKKIIEELNAEQRRAAESVIAGAPVAGSLVTLAGADATKYKGLLAAVARTRRESGLGVEQAGAIQLGVERVGGGEAERKLIAGLAGRHIIEEPGGMLEAATTLQETYGGKAGNVRQIVNQVLVAAREARTRPEDFTGALRQMAQPGAMVHASPQEMMATVVQMQRSTKSPEAAAKELEGFARAMVTHGIRAEGFVGAAEAIQGKGWSDRKVKEFFGPAGAKAYETILAQRGDIRHTEAALRETMTGTGGAKDYADRLMRTWNTRPELVAELEKRKAEQGAEVTRMEQKGTAAIGRERIKAMVLESLQREEPGYHPGNLLPSGALGRLYHRAGLELYGSLIPKGEGFAPEQVWSKENLELLKRIEDGIDKIENNTRPDKRGSSPPAADPNSGL